VFLARLGPALNDGGRSACTIGQRLAADILGIGAAFASAVLEIKFAYGPAERKAALTNLLLRVRGAGILRVARRAQATLSKQCPSPSI